MSDDYFGDVVYAVWRSGGNPDAVDRDRVEDSRLDGLRPGEVAEMEVYAQRPLPEPCPQGCGGMTDDPYGGPCQACWDRVPPVQP